ncbi:MAG TPA: hypothetical protein VF299_05775 [Mycobacterium sp.]
MRADELATETDRTSVARMAGGSERCLGGTDMLVHPNPFPMVRGSHP